MRIYSFATRKCVECGADFEPKAANHYFCQPECKKIYRRRVRSSGVSRTKACVRCGDEFEPESNRQIYCSRNCKQGVRTCDECGKDFSPARNSIGRFCSPNCFYEHSVPEGSTRAYGGNSGYTITKVPKGTPGRLQGKTQTRWMLTHRYVMQQKLGRTLEKHERVHHLNGVRNDNRPENLELWQHSHPSGVRKLDAVKDAIRGLPAADRRRLMKWLQDEER